jgi:hypothetical protein
MVPSKVPPLQLPRPLSNGVAKLYVLISQSFSPLSSSNSAHTTQNRDNREQGGYLWGTYKALCRHDGGPFTNGLGTHDFNAFLTAPLLRHIATSWEMTFTRRIPAILTSHVKSARELILTFHNSVSAQAGPARVAHLHLLAGQLTNHGDFLSSTASEIIEQINAAQKEVNREFVPGVQNAMRPAYELCSAEAGSGCFMRMKAHMNHHVSTNNVSMFETTVNSIRDRLLKMVRVSENAMQESTAQLYKEMQRNYMSIFGGTSKPKDFSGGAGIRERELKAKVRVALEEFQTPFKIAAGLLPDPEWIPQVAPLPEALLVDDDDDDMPEAPRVPAAKI